MTAATTLLDRDPIADAESLSARLEVYREREQQIGPRPIDREAEQPAWPADVAVPEIHADDFCNETLLSAMASRGCLIVRGFFDPAIADIYVPIIDELLDSVYLASKNTEETPLQQSLNNPGGSVDIVNPAGLVKLSRISPQIRVSHVRESAGICEQLLEFFGSRGLKEIIGNYLGEQPCLSALKWVLRRSLLPVNPAGSTRMGLLWVQISTVSTCG